jgi:hypothetical protein
MDKDGGGDDQQFGVAKPGQIGAQVVEHRVPGAASHTHQHQLDWNGKEEEDCDWRLKLYVNGQVCRYSMMLSMNLKGRMIR